MWNEWNEYNDLTTIERIRDAFYNAAQMPVTESDILSPEAVAIREGLTEARDPRTATVAAVRLLRHYRAREQFKEDEANKPNATNDFLDSLKGVKLTGMSTEEGYRIRKAQIEELEQEVDRALEQFEPKP